MRFKDNNLTPPCAVGFVQKHSLHTKAIVFHFPQSCKSFCSYIAKGEGMCLSHSLLKERKYIKSI